MSGGAVAGFIVLLFILLSVLGVPVAFAITASAFVGALMIGVGLDSMVGEVYAGVNSIPLLAVPFFILIGELMSSSNVVERLIRFAQTLVGHIRGGLAQVVVIFSMFFAGISGSSNADVAAVGRIMLPSMRREGYDPANSAAVVAASSTIANMIPPSIMAVVYGATAGVSIAALFVAGVLPGVLIGLGLIAYNYFFGFPGQARQRSSSGEIARSAGASVIPLMVPVIIMAGILGGWFTPTEAGVVAIAYTIVVVIPLMARGHLRNLPKDFANAAVLFSLPLMAVAGASAFAWIISYVKAPQDISGWIESAAGTNGILIMFLLVAMLMVAGNFIDAIPAIVITVPVISPLAELGGIDPVHMGVVAVVTLAFGMITPPYGLALLLSTSFAEVRFSQGLLKAIPLYMVFAAVISIMVLFPGLVLWLPGIVGVL